MCSETKDLGVFMTENKNVDHVNTPSEEKPHKRRVRYSGKYPKKFSEKYKEQNPEKYGDQIQHVISKGNTPAGMHISIMVQEILDALQIQPGMKGLDCTLGYGGHSTALCKKLEGEGHLYSLDIDPIEIVKTTKRMRDRGFDENIWTPIHTNFRNIGEVAREHGPFDFIMADLGVSSMQIDNPERGFTWREDGPLDLRFNPESGVSAAERLKELDRDEMTSLFIENADEPYARDIADAIYKTLRAHKPLETSGQLKQLIEDVVLQEKEVKNLSHEEQKKLVKKSCTRVFQAIRIDVNQEFEVLYEFLEQLPDALAPGGRVAILTFHSGEDRLVKKFFKMQKKMGLYSEITEDVIRPSKEECYRNPRAHSTKLRYAIKS
jgi:16S rRNA (cytosine1402-N4)-methyltransferase